MHSELLALWPSEVSVNECILSQAESFDQIVFLAVHQPMRFRREVVNALSAESELLDEKVLLDTFLQDNPPHGSLILPIVGNSGVGKSHAVKWLYSRISNDNKRYCIWIRKGASLKRVLEELLSGLDGPQYEGLRSRLRSAREKLPPELTAKYLRSNLIQQIKESAIQADERIKRQGKSHADNRLKAYGRNEMLPAALEDQHLWRNHFYGSDENPTGILYRIAEHVTSDGGADIDNRKHQFEAEDFRLPDTVKIGSLSLEAREFFKRLNDQDDRRQDAADVANAAIDAAKRDLLGLSGESLMDIFTDLRRELLKDQRELIMLVEDFVVLSGLQGALLDVITAPAVRDGRQELCTMRSALAYTTGYLTHDTVLTRAGHVWHLDESIPDEEIWPRIQNLVGSYLNAARVGQAELGRIYKANPGGQWPPTFAISHDPGLDAVLDAFGKAPNGYPLFPLNSAAIEQLTFDTYSGRSCYNPRGVINAVLRPILQQRRFFEIEQFPPLNLKQDLRSADVIEQVKLKSPPDEISRQMKFLAYWGGQPRNKSELGAIAPQLWTAFSLSLPDVEFVPAGAPRAVVVPEQKLVSPPVVSATGPSAPPMDEFERKWRPILEAWQDGQTIPQKDANYLRSDIATAILASIPRDWPGYGNLPSRDILRDKVYLPCAGGGKGLEPEAALVVVCTDQERSNPEYSAPIRMELEAIVRFHSIDKDTWDYQGGESLSARYATFIRRHRPSVMKDLCGRPFDGTDSRILSPLISGLSVGAAALDLRGANNREAAKSLEPIFIASKGVFPESTTDWEKVLEHFQKIRRVENGEPGPWVRAVLDAFGVRQGAGNKIYAIDAASLRPLVQSLNQRCELLDVEIPKTSDIRLEQFRSAYIVIKNQFGRLAREQQASLARWRKRTIDFFGDDLDAEVFDKSSRELLTLVKAEGLESHETIEKVRKSLSDFKKAALKSALTDTAYLDEEKSLDRRTLAILGRDYKNTYSVSDQLRTELEITLRNQAAKISKQREIFGGDKVNQSKNALEQELKRIEIQLEVYKGLFK